MSDGHAGTLRRAPHHAERRRSMPRLCSAAAVRERCRMVHRWVADGRSPHFTLDESKLAAVAAYVAEVTRAAYPDLTDSLSQPLAPFSRRRHRPLERACGRSPPTASSGRASPSISRPSACCSTPAPATPGAIASRAPGRCSSAPRDWRSRASTCFAPAAFSGRSRATLSRRRVGLRDIDAGDAGAPFPGRRRAIRWSAWSGAARCCAGSDRRSPSGPICSAARPRVPAI